MTPNHVPIPPAVGARPEWADIPERVQEAVEHWLGSPVVSSTSRFGRAELSPDRVGTVVTRHIDTV